MTKKRKNETRKREIRTNKRTILIYSFSRLNFSYFFVRRIPAYPGVCPFFVRRMENAKHSPKTVSRDRSSRRIPEYDEKSQEIRIFSLRWHELFVSSFDFFVFFRPAYPGVCPFFVRHMENAKHSQKTVFRDRSSRRIPAYDEKFQEMRIFSFR